MKTKLLQGAALAALAYAFAQQALADEATPIVANTSELETVIVASETDLQKAPVSAENSQADMPSLIDYAEHSGLRLTVATSDAGQTAQASVSFTSEPCD